MVIVIPGAEEHCHSFGAIVEKLGAESVVMTALFVVGMRLN